MSIDNLDIIKRLIAEKECGRVEFKETTGQLERGMETLCAFLNGEGGTVLFGVTDKGKIRSMGQIAGYYFHIVVLWVKLQATVLGVCWAIFLSL